MMKPRTGVRRTWWSIVVLALVGVALSCNGSSSESGEFPFLVEKPAAPYSSNRVCSLLNADGNGAQILGQDGGTTNVAEGRVWWTFGDTLLKNGGFEPNNVAYSTDLEASDCIDLEHKVGPDGNAAALLDERSDEEITVWPAAGQAAVEPGFVHFLYNSVAEADNYLGIYGFHGVGLAKFDTETQESRRVVEYLVTEDDLREGESLTLTPATDMLEHDGFVYVYLAVDWNVRAGRVPAAEIENKTAYRWWDGAAWNADIAQSVDVLRTAGGQQAFNVAYNPYIGKWTGIYSTNTLTAIAIAYADAPEGPFVDETILFDCTGLTTIGLPEVFPVLFNSSFECYHATQHPEFDKNDRQTMFLTYGNLASYRLFLHRFDLAVPFAQYEDEQGGTMYSPPGDEAPGPYTKRGVAFYVPVEQAGGLTPIHHWYDAATDAHRYEAQSPGPSYEDRGTVFHAAQMGDRGLVAVYRWEGDEPRQAVYSTFDLEEHGYTRGPLVFYAATLEGQQFYDEASGYVYWVHIRGKQDFNCCYVPQNPTRQTADEHADFALKTDPHPDGYEAVVCSPTCGTGGRIVWSGPVEFEPNAKDGRLRISPEGPLKNFR